MLARKRIHTLLASTHTPKELREKLALVLQIRDFASHVLGLPDNGSYRCYADLGRPYSTWNVFAAPRLSVEPVLWSFPVVGKVVYRGYFSLQAAEQFAAQLTAKGNDTYIHGSVAYSTLGWFDDPVLNTFIDWEPAGLAGVIFHELAHQKIFVSGNSFFNEAFATTVEHEGVRRWLQNEGTPEALARWEDRQRQEDSKLRRLLTTRAALAELYASDLSPDEKLKEKAALGLNNAYLIRVATYYSRLPYFEDLLTRENRDLTRFYRAVKSAADKQSPLQKSHCCHEPRTPTSPC